MQDKLNGKLAIVEETAKTLVAARYHYHILPSASTGATYYAALQAHEAAKRAAR